MSILYFSCFFCFLYFSGRPLSSFLTQRVNTKALLVFRCLLGKAFSKATADIEIESPSGIWRKQAKDVSGALQENGDFIFTMDTGKHRRLIRTSNAGFFIEAGYLALPAANWEKSENWEKAIIYRVVNFAGFTGNN